jgi:hypothetical protein
MIPSRNLHLPSWKFYTPRPEAPSPKRFPLFLSAVYSRMKAFALATALSLLATPALGYRYEVFSDYGCGTKIGGETKAPGAGADGADQVMVDPNTMSIRFALQPSDGTNIMYALSVGRRLRLTYRQLRGWLVEEQRHHEQFRAVRALDVEAGLGNLHGRTLTGCGRLISVSRAVGPQPKLNARNIRLTGFTVKRTNERPENSKHPWNRRKRARAMERVRAAAE